MPSPSRHHIHTAQLGLLFTSFIWGINVIALKLIMEEINPFQVIFYRFAIAAALLALYLFFERRSPFLHWRQGLWLGILLWISYVLVMWAIKISSPVNASFIGDLLILFTPILYFLIFHRRSSLPALLAIPIALAGFYFLTDRISNIQFGDYLMLAGVAVDALYLTLADQFLKERADPVALAFQQFAVVAVLAWLTISILRVPAMPITGQTLLSISYLALLPTLAATVTQLYAQKYVSPVATSFLLSLTPLFTLALAWLLRTELLSFQQILGGGLIVVAVVISEVNPKRLRFLHLRS